jgi:hypothetical protein
MKKLLSIVGIASLLVAADPATTVQNVPETVNTDLTGTAQTNVIIPNDPILKMSPIIILRATGEGVAPINSISPAQARALARRAAMADAYRVLGEKMYGIRLSAKETVRDMVMKHSEIRTQVYAIIKGGRVDDESFQNGLYRVTMEVKLNAQRWQQYLAK